MTSVMRNVISTLGLRKNQRTETLSTVSRRQESVVQQPVAPLHSGGGTLNRTQSEHPSTLAEQLHQSDYAPAKKSRRFKRFFNSSLFHKKRAQHFAETGVEPRHQVDATYTGSPPRLQLNLPDEEESIEQALDALWDRDRTGNADSALLRSTPLQTASVRTDAVSGSPSYHVNFATPDRLTASDTSENFSKLTENVPVKILLEDNRNATVLSECEIRKSLLSQTIGDTNRHYQYTVSDAANLQHALLEDSGRLISLHALPHSLIGVASTQADETFSRKPDSRPFLNAKGHLSSSRALTFNDDNDICISELHSGRVNLQAKVMPPDTAILCHLSGIFIQRETQRLFRMHDGKMYQMEDVNTEWKHYTLPGTEADKSITRLSLQQNAQLFCIYDNHTLYDVNAGAQSSPVEANIKHFSVSTDGKAFLLVKSEENSQQSIKHLPQLNASAAAQITWRIEPSAITLNAIAHVDNTLFSTDSQGKIRVATTTDAQDVLLFGAGENRVLEILLHQKLNKDVGEGYFVEDLIHGENNRLHAVVKDAMDRKHALVISPFKDGERIQSAWNLSDSLVLNYNKGLPQISPDPEHIVSISQGGLLTLAQGKVHFFNDTTQAWEATEIEATSLRCGQDGQAWITTDKNDVKKLKLNFSSNKIQAGQNTFALYQVKKSVKADTAMVGTEPNHERVATAILDNGRFAQLGDDGDIHIIHVNNDNRRERHAPLRLGKNVLNQAMRSAVAKTTEHLEPNSEYDSVKGGHAIKDIAIGPSNRLFILSNKGTVFSIAAEYWLRGRLDDMKIENVPEEIDDDGHAWNVLPDSFLVNQRERLLLKIGEDLLANDGDGHWRHVDAENALRDTSMNNYAERYFTRISRATPEGKIVKTGLTYKREVNTFGQTGHDSTKVHTGFRTRLNTFVFRPLTRLMPLTNAYALVTHKYGGRKGLTVIYEEQSKQFEALNHILSKPHVDPAALPLDEQLALIKSRQEAPEWLEDVVTFNHIIAQSTTHQARQIKERYEKVQAPVKTELNAFTNHMNPATLRNSDLLNKLLRVFEHYPGDTANHAYHFLSALAEKKVKLCYQKENVPFGLHRDKYDKTGLIKSRLILDAVTLIKLHHITTRVASALQLPDEQRQTELDSLKQEFRRLRLDEWENNPINQITRQGFTDNDRLEANYDAMKTMLQAFSQPEHAVNVTARTVTHAKDQADLIRRLDKTVRTMQKGESISFSRAYTVTGTFSGAPSTHAGGVIAAGSIRGNLARNYNMTLTRGEGAINISLGRDGGGSVTVIGGIGYNVLTDHMKAHPIHIDSNRDLLPTIRFGGVMSARPLDLKKQNSVSFDITEADFPQFIRRLEEGTLDPLTLLNMGVNHSVKHGNVATVSLDANFAVEASVGFPVTPKSEKHVISNLRTGLIANVGGNLMSATRERDRTRKEDSTSYGRSNNRIQILSNGFAGVSAAIPLGVSVRDDRGRIPFFTALGASVQLSVDSTTKHNLSVTTKVPREIASTDIEELTNSIKGAFTDSATVQLLEELKDPEKEDNKPRLTAFEKMTRLNQHFTPRNMHMHNNSQRESLRKLDKLIRQHQAWQDGNVLLDGAEHKITVNNMSKVTGESVGDMLAHMMKSILGPADLSSLHDMIQSDAELAALVKTLQDNTSATAVVTFELKDEERDALEERLLSGTNVPDDLHRELLSPGKMRIKAVEFTKNQIKNDGFGTPAFLLGGSSSASVSMKRSLGKINFSYGANQDTPVGYSLEGRIANANEALAQMLLQGQQQHWGLKS
ncbi:AvrE-family type 3 secretion system effector [Pantoea stewartii]|uniref:AvrE-family type 3 secretion system effector n=1 Tax=Pantoea stewartii TaxID=66269 RepID=UPI00197F215D|nr:AvrE-family type 3 secretion system effector [Pantoea stewartii]